MLVEIFLGAWLLVSVANAAAPMCTNANITDQHRQLFLNMHNEGRLSISKGLEPNKCGTLPTGKNIYQLSWSCDLEQAAQDYIQTCPSAFGDFSSIGQVGQWIQRYSGSGLEAQALSLITTTLNNFWAQVRTNGFPADYKYTSTLFQFAQMAVGKATAVGCTYKSCGTGGTSLTIICLYNAVGYITNALIYEPGTACVNDGDCTTYASSTCLANGLCYSPPPTQDPGTNTQCGGTNTQMTDAARDKFVQMHNYLRSRGVNGLEPDFAGGFAPKGSQSLKMVWDCSIETNAQNWADGCNFAHSLPAQRPGNGENLYMTSNNKTKPLDAAGDSSQAWWDELKEFGVGQANNLTDAVWANGIGHYTQMAWHNTYKLGCGVTNCPNKTLVVCQYGPAGNVMNQLIYPLGNPCTDDSGCPGTYTCSVSEGLCNVV